MEENELMETVETVSTKRGLNGGSMLVGGLIAAAGIYGVSKIKKVLRLRKSEKEIEELGEEFVEDLDEE